MTPEEYINKVKKNRWHAVSGGWLGTFVTEEDALAAVELAREEMKKLVEQLKAKAEKRYDEIDKSGYIQPNQPLVKGTDNVVTIEYANNHNKEHAANLGYYNGVIRTCKNILSFLKKSEK